MIQTVQEDHTPREVIEEDDDDRYLNTNTYRKHKQTKFWTEGGKISFTFLCHVYIQITSIFDNFSISGIFIEYIRDVYFILTILYMSAGHQSYFVNFVTLTCQPI